MKKIIMIGLFIALLYIILISSCTQKKAISQSQQPDKLSAQTEQPSSDEPMKGIPSPPSIQIKEGESVVPPAPPED